MHGKVYIIVLNYKHWEDTVECVQSLQKLVYKGEVDIIVVDNCSQNNSLENIQHRLVDTHSPFPVHYMGLYSNGGFAKGNNAGLHFALQKGDGAYFWVLNNDTTVDSSSLEHLVAQAENDKRHFRRIGLYGTKLRYYAFPEKLQAVGGIYNKWFATLKEKGNLEIDKGQYDEERFPNVLVGASLFATKDFLHEVGLLGEDYFIYFEEEDWAERARRRDWGMCVVTESIVYHKQGVATQANGLNNNHKSRFSDFFYFRNRLRVTARFFPYCLPTVYLSFVFIALNRIRRKQWDRLGLIIYLMFRFRTAEWKG